MSDDEDLVAQLKAISPVDEREERSIAATLTRLALPGDPYDEELDSHHLTASAFVISSRGVILHRHRRLGIWVQPGGHVDRGESPREAVLRETLEETGLVVHHPEPESLFHVDQHPGPRGHTHYDLRYVVISEPDDPSPGALESPEVFWFDYDAAVERCEPALVNALGKLRRAAKNFDVQDSNGE
jgi:8-oxo-dGTP pyrophosphatase MutT (NUDIX family)